MTARRTIAPVAAHNGVVSFAVLVAVVASVVGVVLVSPSPVDAERAPPVSACLASLQTVAEVYGTERAGAGGGSVCTYRDEDGWQLLRITVGDVSPELTEQIKRDALLVAVEAEHYVEPGSIGDAAVIHPPDRAEFVAGNIHVSMRFTRGVTTAGIITVLEETAEVAADLLDHWDSVDHHRQD